MEIKTTNMSRDALLSKTELLKKIKSYSHYFNKEYIEILTALVMLDESVFKHVNFIEDFNTLDFFFEIAKYNICKRTINTIDAMNSIDSNKIRATYWSHNLFIDYLEGEKKQFQIFEFAFGQQKPFSSEKSRLHINLYDSTTPIEKTVEEYTSSINSLKNIKHGRDIQPGGLTWSGEEYDVDVYGGPNSQACMYEMQKVKSLEEKIEKLKSYGELQFTVCNDVNRTLLNDWNIEPDRNYRRSSIVKKLSWIEIDRNK